MEKIESPITGLIICYHLYIKKVFQNSGELANYSVNGFGMTGFPRGKKNLVRCLTNTWYQNKILDELGNKM